MREYIEILKMMFPLANDKNIKVWFTQPSLSDLNRVARIVSSMGEDKVYFTTPVNMYSQNDLHKIEQKYNVVFYDHYDLLIECNLHGRYDLSNKLDEIINSIEIQRVSKIKSIKNNLK